MRGGARVEITSLTYDARRGAPGALHFCVPGFRADGHDFAAAAVERGAAALVVERSLDARRAAAAWCARRGRRWAPAADRFYGHPSHELRRGRRHRHQRQDHDRLPDARRAGGRRPAAGPAGHGRVAGRRRGRGRSTRTTPESIDLQATFRRMLDAGDRSCAMEVSSHALALDRVAGIRFAAAALHQPDAGPPRLPRRRWRTTSLAKRACSTGAARRAVNVGDEYGRRLAREAAGPVLDLCGARRRGRRAPARARDRRGRRHLADRPHAARAAAAGRPAARRLQRRERALRRRARRAAGAAARGGAGRRRRRCTGVPGRFEPVDAGQPFTVLVDYAHTPDALENVLRAARGITTGRADLRVRLRRRPRPRQAAADGRRGRGGSPTASIVTSDNPRSEDPAAIVAEITGAASTWRSSSTAARAIARAVARGRAGRRRRDRRQGPRAGPAVRRRARCRSTTAWSRARRSRLLAPRVIELTAPAIAALRAGRRRRRRGRSPASPIDSREVRPGRPVRRAAAAAHATAPRFADRRCAPALPRRWSGEAHGRADGAVIAVDDPLAALGAIGARGAAARAGARSSAITGSTGKTSTKDILRGAGRAARCRAVASRAEREQRDGLPLTLTRIAPDTEVAISRWRCAASARSPTWPRSRGPDVGIDHRRRRRCTSSCWARSSRSRRPRPSCCDAARRTASAVVPHGEPLLDAAPAQGSTRAWSPSASERAPTCGWPSFAPPAGRGEAEIALARSNAAVPVNFTAPPQRPQPGGGRRRLRRARACRWTGSPRARRRARSRAGAARSSRCPAAACLIADCYNANPTSMRAALAHLADGAGRPPARRRAGRHGRARRDGAAATTARWARCRPSWASSWWSRRRARRAATAASGSPTATRPSMRSAELRPARRRGAGQGQPLDGPGGGGGGARAVKLVLLAGVHRDACSRSSPGPRSSRSCAAARSASRSARRARPDTCQAGHADDGRPLPAGRARWSPFAVLTKHTTPGLTVAGVDPRLRGDRLRRTTGSSSCTSARWACRAAGRCCCCWA